jgi:hypothetical protein
MITLSFTRVAPQQGVLIAGPAVSAGDVSPMKEELWSDFVS